MLFTSVSHLDGDGMPNGNGDSKQPSGIVSASPIAGIKVAGAVVDKNGLIENPARRLSVTGGMEVNAC
jgi:hypothetical protein